MLKKKENTSRPLLMQSSHPTFKTQHISSPWPGFLMWSDSQSHGELTQWSLLPPDSEELDTNCYQVIGSWDWKDLRDNLAYTLVFTWEDWNQDPQEVQGWMTSGLTAPWSQPSRGPVLVQSTPGNHPPPAQHAWKFSSKCELRGNTH